MFCCFEMFPLYSVQVMACSRGIGWQGRRCGWGLG